MIHDRRITFSALMTLLILITTGGVLFFYQLDQGELTNEATARTIVYARGLTSFSDWIAPTLHDQIRLDTFPAHIWIVKIISLFSSSLGAFEARIPSAFAALIIILFAATWMYWHTIRYSRDDIVTASGEGVAILAGLMLATSPALFLAARSATSEVMGACLYLIAAFFFCESIEQRRSFYAETSWRLQCLWGYIIAGIAMFIQGPLMLIPLLGPYALATWSYRLRKPNKIHAIGITIALLIGFLWPLTVLLTHSEVRFAPFFGKWIGFQLENDLYPKLWPHTYLINMLLKTFPWVILSGLMAIQVLKRKERTPTLVFWTMAFCFNLIFFALISPYLGARFVPPALFGMLLASEAFYRWNFENHWSLAWRVILRISAAIAIALGIFLTILLESDLGLTLFLILPFGCIIWSIYNRTHPSFLSYTPWESSIRLTALALIVGVAAEILFLNYGESRSIQNNPTLRYFTRIKTALENHETLPCIVENDLGLLYEYHLWPRPVQRVASLDQVITQQNDTKDYALFARNQLESYRKTLLPVTFLHQNGIGPAIEGMFQLHPLKADNPDDEAQPDPEEPTTHSLTQTVIAISPLIPPTQSPPIIETQPTTPTYTVAFIGWSGSHERVKRRVGEALGKFSAQQPIDDVLILGNNLSGPTVADHLSFVEEFEYPYRHLLESGTSFHAVLGHEDQSYALIQSYYPPFNMNEQRYYSALMGGGRIEFFALDAEPMLKSENETNRQLKWLDQTLANSKAPWKIVGLSRPALTAATRNLSKTERALADKLTPLLQKHAVHLVAWSGGRWYERLQMTPQTLAINTGWSGGAKQTRFELIPQLKAAYSLRGGYVVITFGESTASLQAFDSQGALVDEATLNNGLTTQ